MVGADQDPGHAIERLCPLARDEADRESLAELLPQLMADLVARECGEGHFEDDEARQLESRSVDDVVSAVHLHNVVARFHENTSSKRTRLRLVVGDQNRSQTAGVACRTFLAPCFTRCHTPSFLRSSSTRPRTVFGVSPQRCATSLAPSPCRISMTSMRSSLVSPPGVASRARRISACTRASNSSG